TTLFRANSTPGSSAYGGTWLVSGCLRSANGTSRTTTEGWRSRHQTSRRRTAAAGECNTAPSITSRGQESATPGTGSPGPTTTPRPRGGGPGKGGLGSTAPEHTGRRRHRVRGCGNSAGTADV